MKHDEERLQLNQQEQAFVDGLAGHYTPPPWTSAQRARWFRRGLDTGDVARGDTFNATTL